MKKLIAPAIVVFMAMAGMQVQAQTTVAEVKKENKADEKELKKDVRSVNKELRTDAKTAVQEVKKEDKADAKALKKEVKAVNKELRTEVKSSAKEVKKENRIEKKAEHKALRQPEGKQVSSAAKDNFIADFGKIDDVKWFRGPQFDEATFTKDGKTTTAYYDYDSHLVGTTTNKKFTDLPADAQKEIKKRYKDYVTGAIIKFDDNEANDTNMLFYGIQFDDADHYFVTVAKDGKEIILMVSMNGEVSYFKEVSK